MNEFVKARYVAALQYDGKLSAVWNVLWYFCVIN